MLERSLNYLIAFSFLVFVVGVIARTDSAGSASLPTDVAPTSVERALAISQARERGDKTYSFSTNFIPGLGQVADAEAYKKAHGLIGSID